MRGSMSRRYSLWIVGVIVFALFLVMIRINTNLPFKKDELTLEKELEQQINFVVSDVGIDNDLVSTIRYVRALKRRINGCLLKILTNSNSFWKDFTTAVEQCSGFLFNTLPLNLLRNWDDYKYILLPVKQRTNVSRETQCTVLTIGIGKDIKVEEKLAALIPTCRFLGVDPIYDSGKIYETIGTFLNVAVSDRNQTIEASVLANGSYRSLSVPSVNFYDVLGMTGSNVIDYFFLDAEGAEYPIFSMLRALKGNTKYSICQIAVEIHGFADVYHMTEKAFKAQMLDLFANSTFSPITGTHLGFNRMLWMDLESPVCIAKYLSNFWTSDDFK